MESDPIDSEIEKYCDQFEDDWRENRLPNIEAFVANCNGCDRRELLSQLIALDMEYSLRRNSASPRLEEYTKRFSDELTQRDLANLAIKEFRYRQQWGDRPNLYEFLERFPILERELEQPLREYAAQITPTIIGVYRDKRLLYEMRLNQHLEIGRQQHRDPSPITSFEKRECTRLVVASRENRLISRRQIVIEIVARDGIRVQNTGHNRVVVELSEPLEPGGSIILTRPTVLKVADIAIRLSQP